MGKKIESLSMQVNKLMDEQKELEIVNQELQTENKKLRLRCIDIQDYKSWNYEQVLIWIMSINDGEFNKYKEILDISLKEEGVHGCHLEKVNEADIKGWGIKNFDDKKNLMTQIKQLVNNNQIDQVATSEDILDDFIFVLMKLISTESSQ